MAKLRTRSGKIDIANKRVASLTALGQPVELGGELSLAAYQGVVAEVKTKQSRYNGLITEAEQARRDYLNAEKVLSDWSERMLAGVGAYYGKNSEVYAKAGGVKKSERKRPAARLAASTAGVPIANAA